MHRIAEHIFLWAVLIVTTGLTLGLTWLPCFASVCTEEFFPTATRTHIGVQAGIIAVLMIALLLRAHIPLVRSISEFDLTKRPLPVMGKRLSIGGILAFAWIVAIVLATLVFWKPAIIDFWQAKGYSTSPDWYHAAHLMTVVTDIAHHADSLLGLVLIPVGRNSLIGRTFKVHQSTLIFAHSWLAYLLILDSLAHGIAYFLFMGTYYSIPVSDPRRQIFDINNPTLTPIEVRERGNYYAINLASGIIAWMAMAVMVVTALPWMRRRYYNIFYYCHITGAIVAFVFASIHASTDFYFLLPGLVLWTYDWIWRMYNRNEGLSKKVKGTLEDAGEGWYRITLPPATETAISDPLAEKQALDSPIQTYYLNIPSISSTQNHAFTAARMKTATAGPVFLFQRSQAMGKRTEERMGKEWTWKIGSLASSTSSSESSGSDSDVAIEKPAFTTLDVRVEGPYSPGGQRGYEDADHVICIVGGTGLTGAHSLALWWLEHRATTDAKFSLVWLVRHRQTANLQEWTDLNKLQAQVAPGNMDLILHVSREEGRLDSNARLRELCQRGERNDGQSESSVWVYGSGPPSLLSSVETACLEIEREIKPTPWATVRTGSLGVRKIEHYVAHWEI